MFGMKNYFIYLLLICSCTAYEGSKESTTYNKIDIYFYGRSEIYYTEEAIKITVTDSTNVYRLNELKNLSKPILFGGRKGNEYTINLVFTDSDTGDELLIRILKNIGLKPTIIYGNGTIFDGSYRNDELVKYIASIIKLDAIKEYEGSLTRKGYKEFILKETN